MHRLEFFFLSFPFFFKLFLPNQFDDGWFIDSPPIYWPLFFFFCTPFEWLCSISNDFLFNRVVSFFSLSLSLSDSAGNFFYLLGIFFHTHIFIFWYLCVECIESFKFLVKSHFFFTSCSSCSSCSSPSSSVECVGIFIVLPSRNERFPQFYFKLDFEGKKN